MTKQLVDGGKLRLGPALIGARFGLRRLSDRRFERASRTQIDVETLRTIVVVCGVGLVVVLLLAEGITSLGVTPGDNGWDIMGWI